MDARISPNYYRQLKLQRICELNMRPKTNVFLISLVIGALVCCVSATYQTTPNSKTRQYGDKEPSVWRPQRVSEKLVAEIELKDDFGLISFKVYSKGIATWPGGELKILRLFRDQNREIATVTIKDEYWLRDPILSNENGVLSLQLLARPGEKCKRVISFSDRTFSIGAIVFIESVGDLPVK